MKTVLKPVVFVFFLLALAHAVLAGNDERRNEVAPEKDNKVVALDKFAYSLYAVSDKSKMRLAFENLSQEDVVVKIYNNDNALIHSERHRKTEGLKRDYIMSEIGNGSYRMDIKCGDFVASRQVSIGMTANAGPFVAHVSHVVKDGKIQVAYQNGQEGVYIALTNQNGAVLYTERTEAQSNFARRYDLSRLQPGEYTMTVICGSKTIEQTYVIGR